MTEAAQRLRGLRVLLLEDSALVAMHIEEMLAEAGCEVVATLDNVGRALEFIRTQAVEAAILDVNLQGDKVFGVAAELQQRGVPFVFSTGYDEGFTPRQFHDAPHLTKPFEPEVLWVALAQAASKAGSRPVPPRPSGASGRS